MNKITKLILTASLMLTATFALAHPGHDAHTHSNFISGLLHPISGLDHLLAMAAIGFWSVRQSDTMKRGVPLFVLGGMIVGAAIAWAGITIPGVETSIAMSVLLAGVLVATMVKLPTAVGGTLVGLFMIAHGYAHGAEMGTGSMVTYMAGFLITTLAITLVGRGLGSAMLKSDNRIARALGGVVAVIGGMMVVG